MALFFCLHSCVSHAFANNRLPDSTYKDWTGIGNEIKLPDGSTLFEYAARSFSGSTEGAMLSLNFVPRFNCAPTVTVRMPDHADTLGENNSLLVSVDGVSRSYDVLTDREPGFTTYAIAATVDELVALREIFDVSLRVSFSVVDNAQKVDDVPEESTMMPSAELGSSQSVTFSLIGSQLTALAVDTQCRSHEPLSFVRE